MAKYYLKTALDAPLAVLGTLCWHDGPPLAARGVIQRRSQPIGSVSCYPGDVRETLGCVMGILAASSQIIMVTQWVLKSTEPSGPKPQNHAYSSRKSCVSTPGDVRKCLL